MAPNEVAAEGSRVLFFGRNAGIVCQGCPHCEAHGKHQVCLQVHCPVGLIEVFRRNRVRSRGVT